MTTHKMKTHTKVVLGVAGGLVVVGLVAATASGAIAGRDGNCGGGHHRGGHMAGMFEKIDANGDGQVTRAEADQARTAYFGDADTNADGVVGIEEFEAAMLSHMRERLAKRFSKLDDDGDQSLSQEEFTQKTDRMFGWLDRDGDGIIQKEELRSKGRHHSKHGDDHDD